MRNTARDSSELNKVNRIPSREHSRIAELRKQRGVSMSALARSSYVHPSTLSRYERGIMQPGSAVVVQLARELQVSPHEIDPDFNSKLLVELERIETSLKELEELQESIAAQQQKVSELQRTIAVRQKFVASYLIADRCNPNNVEKVTPGATTISPF